MADAGICPTCGRSITHVGPRGECLRCLVRFGFLADDSEPGPEAEGGRLRPAPVRYEHFELEVNPSGFPVILGAGAMAITYRARDTHLNAPVALKVIGRKLAENPTARARFIREAQSAAQIQHQNVARVIHYGEQDGECFYAMELVHGKRSKSASDKMGDFPWTLLFE